MGSFTRGFTPGYHMAGFQPERKWDYGLANAVAVADDSFTKFLQ